MSDNETRSEPRPFNQWLLEQRAGSLHSELSEQLAQVASAVHEHGKAGSLTLKISIRPAQDGTMVIVADDVRAVVPSADRGASLYWTDDVGSLSRKNPWQTELPIREVPRAPEDDIDHPEAM